MKIFTPIISIDCKMRMFYGGPKVESGQGFRCLFENSLCFLKPKMLLAIALKPFQKMEV